VTKRENKKKPSQEPAPPKPVNVVDGVPDRSDRSMMRTLVWIIVIFSAWVAFLVYCRLAGSP